MAQQMTDSLNDWQPISTAHRDGSVILSYHPDRHLQFVSWRRNSRTNTEFWNDANEEDDYELEADPPTHWLQLPPFPNVVAAGGGR